MRACPECAELIQDAAIKCRFCGARFDGQQVTAAAPSPVKTAGIARRWQLIGFVGAGIVAASSWLPLVRLPMVGTLNAWSGNAGPILVGIAAGAALLVVVRAYLFIILAGLSVAGDAAYRLIAFQVMLAEFRADASRQEGLAGDFAQLASAGVGLEWGWAVTFAGSLLLIVSGFLGNALYLRQKQAKAEAARREEDARKRRLEERRAALKRAAREQELAENVTDAGSLARAKTVPGPSSRPEVPDSPVARSHKSRPKARTEARRSPILTILLVVGLVVIGGAIAAKHYLGFGTVPHVQPSGEAPQTAGPSKPDTQPLKPAPVEQEASAEDSYRSRVKVTNWRIGTAVGDIPAVFGEVQNQGDRTLDRVEITIYALDIEGRRVHEEKFQPVFVSPYTIDDRRKEPLRPNYSRTFGVSMENAPSAWDRVRVDVEVSNIRFAP